MFILVAFYTNHQKVLIGKLKLGHNNGTLELSDILDDSYDGNLEG